MSYTVQQNYCQYLIPPCSGDCMVYCPTQCITPSGSTVVIDPDGCTECGSCVGVCPVTAITDGTSSSATDPAHEAADYYLTAEIRLFPTGEEPSNFIACDGSLLQISSNNELYSLIGSRFGGDGSSTFAMPDTREAENSLTGFSYYICTSGVYPQWAD